MCAGLEEQGEGVVGSTQPSSLRVQLLGVPSAPWAGLS